MIKSFTAFDDIEELGAIMPYPTLQNDVQINRVHAGAICKEMGERLAIALGPQSIELQPRLLSLMKQLAEPDLKTKLKLRSDQVRLWEAESCVMGRKNGGGAGMPAKPRIGVKQNCEIVARTFGPVDPDDISDINFLYARRHLATLPGRRGRDLRYVIELQELEELIGTTLDRVRERDGERIGKEAAAYLHDAVDLSVSRNP
jgi:hypothetical protein